MSIYPYEYNRVTKCQSINTISYDAFENLSLSLNEISTKSLNLSNATSVGTDTHSSCLGVIKISHYYPIVVFVTLLKKTKNGRKAHDPKQAIELELRQYGNSRRMVESHRARNPSA